MMAREGITIKYLSHTTAHTWSEGRALGEAEFELRLTFPQDVSGISGTRSAKLMVFVRIGCLEWSEGKSLHQVLSMPSPATAVPHMGNVLPAVSHTPRGLGVRCGGGSFLSLGRPGRDGRRRGGREPARHHARARTERKNPFFVLPSQSLASLSLSLSRWLSEVAGRSERGFERSAREAPSHHHREI